MMIIIISLCCLFFFLFSIVNAASKTNRFHSASKFRSRHSTPHRVLQSSSSSSFSTAIAKLTASDGKTNDIFGTAVAISNNRIVVGANGFLGGYPGKAYLFGDPVNPESGRSYSQLAIITASDGESGDNFGWSVAIDGDTIVIGAAATRNGGTVYVYRVVDDNNAIVTISEVARLTASNGMEGDMFGYPVAINGNIILVGASGVDKNDSGLVGSAYLFKNPSTDPNSPEWTQLQQFQPDDLVANDSFGHSVATDGNIAVIGTSGLYDESASTAYVFVPVNPDDSSSWSSSWTQTAKLTGSTGSYFGGSVAVQGNQIIVGAYREENANGIISGAAFVFSKMSSSSSSWTQMTQLFAADGAAEDIFGISVSISQDASTIVVGAHKADFNGAAYLFQTTETTSTTTTTVYSQNGKFVADDPANYASLGTSTAIENNIVVVGASYDDSANGIEDTGSVYILDLGFSPPSTTAPTPVSVATLTPEETRSPEPSPSITPTSMAPSLVNHSSTPTQLPTTNPPTSIVPSPPTNTPAPTPSFTDAVPTDSPSNGGTNRTAQPSPTKQPTSDSGTVFSLVILVSAIVFAMAIGI
jgi:hypothetical protein